MTTWQDKPIVFVTLPTCPTCGSASRKTTRSVRDPDGSVARRSRCRECGQQYTIVLELPDIGKVQVDTP
jgi:transcriptional regulator NrdR family protein